MPSRSIPGLGLEAFWDQGEDNWDPGMDNNLRELSVVVQPNVLSRIAAVPGSPSAGDRYIITGATNQNDVAVYDQDKAGTPGWYYYTPVEGWEVYDQGANVRLRFNGTTWVEVPNFVQDVEITAAYSVADSDLGGNAFRRVNVATAVVITVPPGLTGTEPCVFIQEGAGQVSFAPGTGVTIKSADGNLKTRVQYASATLIPDASAVDTYYLIGDLAA